jgi:hypothetical protein
MSYKKYSELIFVGAQIANFAVEAKFNEAIALIRGLNPLQSAYAFKFAIESCTEDDLAPLMDFIERIMNEGEKS